MRPAPSPRAPDEACPVCPVCGREPFVYVFFSRGGQVLGCDWCILREEREALFDETGISV